MTRRGLSARGAGRERRNGESGRGGAGESMLRLPAASSGLQSVFTLAFLSLKKRGKTKEKNSKPCPLTRAPRPRPSSNPSYGRWPAPCWRRRARCSRLRLLLLLCLAPPPPPPPPPNRPLLSSSATLGTRESPTLLPPSSRLGLWRSLQAWASPVSGLRAVRYPPGPVAARPRRRRGSSKKKRWRRRRRSNEKGEEEEEEEEKKRLRRRRPRAAAPEGTLCAPCRSRREALR